MEELKFKLDNWGFKYLIMFIYVIFYVDNEYNNDSDDYEVVLIC